MSSARVVSCGWHDTYFRWDLSDPHRVLGRLQELEHVGELGAPGRVLFARKDRFGSWDHFLGARSVMLMYRVEPKAREVIRRLEVQAHLGPAGEDDLCSVESFGESWLALQKRMALGGVLPPSEPRVVRVDPAVDVVFDDPAEGFAALEVLRFARWPRSWYAEWQGPPPYTTVAVKSGDSIIGRAYCRNSKLKNGGARWGKIRFEREHKFTWAQGRPVEELENEVAASLYWGSVFGLGQASGHVTRLQREVEAVKLMERVQLGELGYSQYERMSAFLTAERLGMADRVYSPETLRRRRREAKELGLSAGDAVVEELDVSLDEVLSVARGAWQSSAA